MDTASSQTIRRTIRVKKEDSAYIYFILESYEGMTSYSTLEYEVGSPYRDLELRIPVGFLTEVDDLLKSFGELVYEIESQTGT